jgi:hypothetical protein
MSHADPRAKSIGGMIAALKIFARHNGMGTKYFCDGEHDIIYFCGEPSQDAEDGRALLALGFHWSDSDRWAYHT